MTKFEFCAARAKVVPAAQEWFYEINTTAIAFGLRVTAHARCKRPTGPLCQQYYLGKALTENKIAVGV
jgi:hypothetical protein